MSRERSHDGDEPYDLTGATSMPTATVEMPSPSDPMAVARRLVRDHQIDGSLTLRWWRGAWMQHHGTAWGEVEDAVLRKAVYTALEHAVYWHDGSKVPEQRPWRPNRRKVSDVLDAFMSILHLAESVDPPSWLDHPWPPAPADRIVPCENGLLDVRTRTLHPAGPHYFTRVSVPFAYDPDAGTPVRWLEFLDQLWPDDSASVKALQEFFGYVLSGRTDLQKILLLIGPTRSGKGTIARILAKLVGAGNVAGPTLASLGTNFGLAPLLGKPLAVVSDARLGRGDVHQVVERLLSISGEDLLTVDRKFREPWTGKLPSRFMILSNELPRFGDASGAIANRFVVLTMARSFLGKEDTTLTSTLLAELPAILSWALNGLDRLTKTGTFTQPEASVDAITALQDLVSPVAAFVRDKCTVAAGAETIVAELFAIWRTWCEDNGHRSGSVQNFGRDLRAVVPALRVTRPHGAERRYVGLRLNGSHNGEPRGSSGSRGDDEDLNRSEPRQNPLQPQHEQTSPRCTLCGLGTSGPRDDHGWCTHCVPTTTQAAT